MKFLFKSVTIIMSIALLYSCKKKSPCATSETLKTLKSVVIKKLTSTRGDEIPFEFQYILNEENYQEKIFHGIRQNLVLEKVRTQFSNDSKDYCNCTVLEKFNVSDSIRKLVLKNNSYLIEDRITLKDALKYIDNVDELIYNIQTTDDKSDTIVNIQSINMGKTIVAAYLSEELKLKGKDLVALDLQYNKSEKDFPINNFDTQSFLADNIGKTLFFKQFIPVDSSKKNGPKHKFTLKLNIIDQEHVRGEYSFVPGIDIDSWNGEFQGIIEGETLECSSWETGEGNTSKVNFYLYINSLKAKIIFTNNYYIMDFFG